MKDHDFAWGMTMGIVTGTAIGWAMSPRKKNSIKKATDKAMRTVGEVMETLSDEIGCH